MRRLLPLALLVVACAKPAEGPAVTSEPAPAKIVRTDLTPQQMAKEMGIPLYPKVTAPDGMSSMPETRSDGSTHYSLVLATQDSVVTAAGWYEKNTGLMGVPGGVGHSFLGTLKNGNNARITIAPEAGRTLIRVKAIVYAKR